jgi:Cell wall-associated hydrolases (invasion-associated proteins)
MIRLRFLLLFLCLAGLPCVAEPPGSAPTREELGRHLEALIRHISGMPYNGRWIPPDSTLAWTMDCSNTVRWLYLVTTRRLLPRTASDQYEALRQARRLWRVRATDVDWRSKLRPGDLLFWENTYRPKRKPPITHVMIYLGRNPDGSLRMAGAQGSRGVNIYTFRPEVPYGGYPWFLWFKRQGRFVAYGRPL